MIFCNKSRGNRLNAKMRFPRRSYTIYKYVVLWWVLLSYYLSYIIIIIIIINYYLSFSFSAGRVTHYESQVPMLTALRGARRETIEG